jgi:hypothetical protein
MIKNYLDSKQELKLKEDEDKKYNIEKEIKELEEKISSEAE